MPGYLCLGALIAEDSLLWSAAHAHIGVRTTAALLAATHPAINAATVIFVVGHVLGSALLDFVGWSLLAIGLAGVARVVAREPVAAAEPLPARALA